MRESRIPQEAIDRARNADVIGVAESLGAAFKANSEAGIPCPGCGGTDRFAVSRSKNVFSCRASGEGGDAIRLVRHILGCGFAEAIEILTGVKPAPVRSPAEAASAQREDNAYREKARRAAHGIWRSAGRPGDLLRGYFGLRGLLANPTVIPTLREIGVHPYWTWSKEQQRFVKVGEAPAMIAAITDASGRFVGVHQTWLDLARPNGKAEFFDPETGEQLDAKKVRGSQRGGRIVLRGPRTGAPNDHPQFDRLAVGEGLETVLGWDQVKAPEWTALWVAINLDNMSGRATESVPHPTMQRVDALGRKRTVKVAGPCPDMADTQCLIVPPGRFSRVTFLGDGDSDSFSTTAAMHRARARAPADSHPVIDWAPPGMDWGDVANQAKREAAE